MQVHVHLRSPERDFVPPCSIHQCGELCVVSCGNSSRVDTKRGLRGKAFGSFSLVMRKDAPFIMQLWNT